jgi:hypothetical protein
MIRKRHKPIQEETFVVVNRDGQAFIGLQGGYPVYSDDWSEAKPLYKENTYHLLRENGTELLNTSEL